MSNLKWQVWPLASCTTTIYLDKRERKCTNYYLILFYSMLSLYGVLLYLWRSYFLLVLFDVSFLVLSVEDERKKEMKVLWSLRQLCFSVGYRERRLLLLRTRRRRRSCCWWARGDAWSNTLLHRCIHTRASTVTITAVGTTGNDVGSLYSSSSVKTVAFFFSSLFLSPKFKHEWNGRNKKSEGSLSFLFFPFIFGWRGKKIASLWFLLLLLLHLPLHHLTHFFFSHSRNFALTRFICSKKERKLTLKCIRVDLPEAKYILTQAGGVRFFSASKILFPFFPSKNTEILRTRGKKA